MPKLTMATRLRVASFRYMRRGRSRALLLRVWQALRLYQKTHPDKSSADTANEVVSNYFEQVSSLLTLVV